jgi:hypothetical protein
MNHPQTTEVATVKATVTREESVGLVEGVGADQEIRHNSIPAPRGAAPAGAPKAPGHGCGFGGERIETDAQSFHSCAEGGVLFEMRPHFRPNHVAGEQSSGVVGAAQLGSGVLAELEMALEHVQKDR